LKEIEKEVEGALAKRTVALAKHWFLTTLKNDRDSVPVKKLKQKLEELVAEHRVRPSRLRHCMMEACQPSGCIGPLR